MPHVQIFIQPEASSKEVFSRIDSRVKKLLREGLDAYRMLGPEARDQLAEAARTAIDLGPYGGRPPDLSSELDVASDVARSLFSTMSIALVVLASKQNTAEGFAEAAATAGIANSDELREASLSLAQHAAKKRDSIRRSLRRGELAFETIPALTDIDMSIDLRLAFSQSNTLTDAIPVVLTRVATDSDSEFWFQMTRQQAERVRADLERAIARMVEAERVADSITKQTS